MTEATVAAEALAARCLEVADLGEAGVEWVGDAANRDKIGAEVMSLRREFRRAVIRSRKLANAARRNMCVGVYGPSQAGKSYLISVLGRPKGGELMAAFDGRGRAAQDISTGSTPKAKGESTGLVTRFTAAKDSRGTWFPGQGPAAFGSRPRRKSACQCLRHGRQRQPNRSPEVG